MVFAARVIANSSRNHTTVHDTTTHDLNMSYMYFPRPLRFGTNHACSLQISIPSTHRTFNGSFTTKPHRSAFSFRKILHLPSETTSMSYLLSSTIRCYNVGHEKQIQFQINLNMQKHIQIKQIQTWSLKLF
eukprot:453627_1